MGVDVMANCFLIAPVKNPTIDVVNEIIHVIGCLRLLFSEVFSVVVESNSDNGFDCKLHFKAERGLEYLQLGDVRLPVDNRVNQIGYARNAGLDEIKSKTGDIIAFMDSGVANHALTVNDMASCFDRNNWDAVTANQYINYYDIWALRAVGWSDSDCWEAYNKYVPFLGKETALDLAVGSKQVVIPETADWIPVQSAFGGFGFFRAEIFKDRRFISDGVKNCCEWPQYFKDLDRVFINPKLRNGGDSTHLAPRRSQKYA
jgi:hypothetical protein